MIFAHNRLRRKPTKRSKPVTLIVGIICKDGIVVAGDSQTTWGSKKSWLANKISESDFANGGAIVAESGAVLTSSKVVEHLTAMAKDRAIDAPLPELASKAVRKVRDALRHQQFDCTAEELQDFINR